jgi:hypothetical protein
MKTLIIKSLLTSPYQREAISPLFGKEGQGEIFYNAFLLTNALVRNSASAWF